MGDLINKIKTEGKKMGEHINEDKENIGFEMKSMVQNLSSNMKETGQVLKNKAEKMGSEIKNEAGNIGKRYRRQDAIGTPYCVTIDYETEKDGCVTVRNRDTMEQVRVPLEKLTDYIKERIRF